MTQKERAIVKAYERSTDVRLRDCYDSWSKEKEEAYNYCIRLKEEKNGKHLRIITHNGWMFTVGFRFTDDNGYPCLMYITKSQDKIINIDEEV